MPLNIGWRSEAHIATKHAPFFGIGTESFRSIKLKDEVAESLESVIKKTVKHRKTTGLKSLEIEKNC
jgi:hypothetical protein